MRGLQQVDPNKLPKVDCNTFKYSSAFLDKYPKAPAACLEGRVYEGTTYAKFNAKVYINNLPNYVTLQLMNVSGTMITTFSVKPQGGGTFYVDGKETPAANLNVWATDHLVGPGEPHGSEGAALADRGVLAGNRTGAEIVRLARDYGKSATQSGHWPPSSLRSDYENREPCGVHFHCGLAVSFPASSLKVGITRSSWLRPYESELLCDHGVEHSRRQKPG